MKVHYDNLDRPTQSYYRRSICGQNVERTVTHTEYGDEVFACVTCKSCQRILMSRLDGDLKKVNGKLYLIGSK